MPKLGILDLVRVGEGWGVAEALNRARDLAAQAENWGYERFWVAEHHNMRGIASSATSVVIGHIAAGSSRIRVGAGGIMLPNHAPMIIAEQFGTLAHLYPGRIDLGLGRAPGTDQATLRALRRSPSASDSFPQDVQELQALLAPARPGQTLIATPGEGTQVPLWILGSSLFGGQLAGDLGLPHGFASHFAPDMLMHSLSAYRHRFEPSAQLARPYVSVGVNIIIGETDEEARRLATTQQMSFTNLFRGERNLSRPPIEDIETYWTPPEKHQAMRMLACSIVGGPDTVRAKLRGFVEQTQADELMVVADIYDHDLRLRSYRWLAEIVADMPFATPALV